MKAVAFMVWCAEWIERLSHRLVVPRRRNGAATPLITGQVSG